MALATCRSLFESATTARRPGRVGGASRAVPDDRSGMDRTLGTDRMQMTGRDQAGRPRHAPSGRTDPTSPTVRAGLDPIGGLIRVSAHHAARA
ncbi:MAG: hypothetical protein MNPFHGCM_00877 [Gemmatimonadaceae bacterium]|nr:hypothetical protein [Gemmatimonadaceae bacterium]